MWFSPCIHGQDIAVTVNVVKDFWLPFLHLLSFILVYTCVNQNQ